MSTLLTIGELLARTATFFKKKEIDQPRLTAEVLLCHVVGLERIQLYVRFDQPMEEAEVDRYRDMVKKRIEGMPVAYILEEKEFMGHSFKVTPAVLVPRPDTEFLVEAGIRYLKEIEAPLFLDICTGSGAILLSVLKEVENAKGIGTDLSPEALKIAKENSQRLGVGDRAGFLLGDLLEPIGERKVHGILSNPPYIPTKDVEGLQVEVLKEPVMALDGGVDGLDFYRRLLTQASNYLLPNGFLFMEVGIHQAEPVTEIAETLGWKILEKPICDYGGIERVVLFGR